MDATFTELQEHLLSQNFDDIKDPSQQLLRCQFLAQGYAKTENAVAVLSDIESNISYIYHGKFARALGLQEALPNEVIPSIWEEEIFNKIHSDDLFQKHLMELQFFRFLKSVPLHERTDYHVERILRMKNSQNEWIKVHHRMFYVCSSSKGSIWLALCLYQQTYPHTPPELSEGCIVHSVTGETIQLDRKKFQDILSVREVEILKQIKKGLRSKEIAHELSISTFTVSRHRQNILQKLRVSNSFEACRIPENMGYL